MLYLSQTFCSFFSPNYALSTFKGSPCLIHASAVYLPPSLIATSSSSRFIWFSARCRLSFCAKCIKLLVPNTVFTPPKPVFSVTPHPFAPEMAARYLVTINDVPYEAIRETTMWKIVSPYGEPLHYRLDQIPLNNHPFHETQASRPEGLRFPPIRASMIPTYPHADSPREKELRFLHGRILADWQANSPIRRLRSELLGVCIRKSKRALAVYKIKTLGGTSYWRQTPVESSWGKRTWDRLRRQGRQGLVCISSL